MLLKWEVKNNFPTHVKFFRIKIPLPSKQSLDGSLLFLQLLLFHIKLKKKTCHIYKNIYNNICILKLNKFYFSFSHKLIKILLF
jgi:hypothetical protein